MTRTSLLKWLERGLLAIGLALGLWCAVVLVRAHQTQNMPLPKVTVTQTVLPGSTTAPPAPVPAPAPGTWIARLEVPSVKLATTVLEGTDDGTLSRGSGHIEDTPFPGQRATSASPAIATPCSARSVTSMLGDAMKLTTADRVYHYKISKTLIVTPDDVYVLDPTDQPTLTLVTCYPFEFIGHAPRRFIVQATLVSDEARVAEAARPAR